jgi:hypothetical protein
MANLVSFYIKSQSRGNKTSPCCLTAGLFTQMVLEYAGKTMFFDKSATKKCCFKLDLQWNQMILTVIFWGFGLLYFNANSM